MDEHVAVRHLDGVGARVGVRDAHKAGVAGWLGRVVGHWVHPEKERKRKHREAGLEEKRSRRPHLPGWN